MAYGSWVNVSGTGQRVRAELLLSRVESATSVTISGRAFMRKDNAAGFASGTSSWFTSGDYASSGTRNWNVSGAGDTDTFRTWSETVARTYADQEYDVAFRINANSLMVSDAFVTATIVIPRRSYSAPATPTGLTATYVSDGRMDLSWSTSPTTAAPVTKAEIRRTNVFADGYSTIATVTSGGLTSYSDRGVRADRHYWYSVRVGNADGWSSWAYLAAPPVYTTPGTPGVPTWKKLSSGDVRVYRPSLSSYAAQWRVRHVLDGVLQGAPLATLNAGAASWVHPSPDPAKRHAYRVEAVSPRSPSGELVSAMGGTSASVQLQAPPMEPSIVGPDVADGDEAIDLEWVHNPVDGSEQRKFELRHRPAPSFSWTSTGEVVSGATSWTLPAGAYPNGGSFEWQVRTWGAHATESPWSETAVTALSSRPVAGIAQPGATHGSARVTVRFTYSDPESTPMVRAEVRLWRENLLLETKTFYSGMLLAATLATRLDDQTTYRVTVRVQDGAGLWSDDAEQVFLVEYAPPPTPTLDATWDGDSGHTVLTVGSPDPVGDEQAVDSIRVERAGDEAWVVVGSGLQPGETVTDPIPPLGRPVTYRAVATSVLESTAYSPDAVVQTDSRWVFVNYGPSLHSVVRLRGNVQVSRSYRRKKSVQHYSGRALPVARSGRELTETYDLSGALIAPHLPQVGSSGWEQFVEMEDAAAPVCVRDPEGARLFCAVAGFDVSGYGSPIRTVSMQFTRVDWSEEQA